MLRHAAILSAVAATLVLTARPAAAEFRLERRLALNPGGSFSLDSGVGSVTIAGDSTSGVTVTITSDDDDLADRLDIQFASAAGTASVTATRRAGGWIDGLFGHWMFHNVHFDVHVPRAATVDIRTGGGSIHAARVSGPARVHTSGGSLTVDDIEKDVDATTSGGSVHLARIGGRVDAHTSGGSIQADDVQGDLRVSTSGGSVDVRDAGGRVVAHTSGGHVTASFRRGNNRGGDLSTSGGGVDAQIDPRVALSIDAGTSGGSVTSDLPVSVRGSISRRSLQGDLNGGGASLRLHSSGGSIHIAAR